MPGLEKGSYFGADSQIARREVLALLEVLKLPIDDRGRRRAAARAEWFAARTQPLDTGDILAELPR